MKTQIVGEFWVERSREELPLPGGNRAPIWQAQRSLGFAPNPRNDRSADEGEVVGYFRGLQEGHRDLDFKGVMKLLGAPQLVAIHGNGQQ